MKVLNLQTNEIVELELVDPRNGSCWVCTFGVENGDFKLREDDDDERDYNFVATAYDLEWWLEQIEKQNQISCLMHELKEQIEDEEWIEVEEELGRILHDDLEGMLTEQLDYLREMASRNEPYLPYELHLDSQGND